jgi:hypothetical protein
LNPCVFYGKFKFLFYQSVKEWQDGCVNSIRKGKDEGKVVPVPFFYRAPRHEGVLGSGGTDPRIL